MVEISRRSTRALSFLLLFFPLLSATCRRGTESTCVCLDMRRGYEEYGPKASIPGWLGGLSCPQPPSPPLPFFLTLSLSALVIGTCPPDNFHSMNSLNAKHGTAHLPTHSDKTSSIPQNLVNHQDGSVGLSPPFFLQTADNGESRCSIKLPAGSWLPPPSLRSFGTWQKPFGHLSPSLRGGAGAVGIRRPFVRHRFRWRGVPRG